MKLEISAKIFEKYLNVKFHENPSKGGRVFPCGRKDELLERRTGRHDEANSSFPQFCESP